MNLVFKTVWNRSRQSFVVASELASGAGKSSALGQNGMQHEVVARHLPCCTPRNAITLAVLALAAATAPHATWAASTCDTLTSGQSSLPSGGGSCVLPAYAPTTNNNGIGAAVVSAGDTVTLSGAPDFQSGIGGVSFVPASTVTPTSGSFNSSAVSLGAQSNAVAGPNAATGNNVVYSTYNSANFADVPNLNNLVTQYADTNGQMYLNASLGSVSASGGTLNVDIGSVPTAPASTNLIDLVDKQSYLTSADGTGTASSSIVWQSRNQIIMGINPDVTTVDQSTGQLNAMINVTTYAGSVTFQGTTYTVTDAAQLASYNNALIAALENGSLTSQGAYNAAFNQAFTTVQQPVTYASNTTAGDAARAPNGDQYAILANGSNASATIAPGGQIDMWYASGAIKAANGAKVTNNGTLSGMIVSTVADVGKVARASRTARPVLSRWVILPELVSTRRPARPLLTARARASWRRERVRPFRTMASSMSPRLDFWATASSAWACTTVRLLPMAASSTSGSIPASSLRSLVFRRAPTAHLPTRRRA